MTRPLARLLMLAPLLVLHVRPAAQVQQETVVALTGVTVIDVTGSPPRSDMTVVVRGNRIAAIGRTGQVAIPQGARIERASGRFLIPGLWDMHTHGLNTLEPLPLFVANGITGVRFMGGAGFAQAVQTRKAIESGAVVGPRVVMLAPVVDGSTLMRPFARVIASEAQAREAVNTLKHQGDFLKVLDTLPRHVYLAFADEARRQGISVVGHVPVDVGAGDASDAGLKSIEHLNGILPAASPIEARLRSEMGAAIRVPGSRPGDVLFHRAGPFVQAILSTYDEQRASELFRRFRTNGTWVCPTLVDHRTFAYPEEFAADPRLRYLPRARTDAWLADARHQALTPEVITTQKQVFQKYLHLVGAMQRAGVGLLAGSDFGMPYLLPGFSLHDELALLVEAGLTPLEALQTATVNPARFLGRLASLGTVEEGKLADLVLLDGNPLEDIRHTQKISGVMLNGRLLSKAELTAMSPR